MPLFSFLSLCLQALNSFISVEHTLFLEFWCDAMLKSLFAIYVCHTMDISSFVYLSHRACFGALLNLCTHTNPLTVVNTCEMLRNTRKATLNRIGTQRKKRGYKGGASYTYAKVRRCQSTQLAAMSMKGSQKTSRRSGVPMSSSRC
jgi:hypothetical protein